MLTPARRSPPRTRRVALMLAVPRPLQLERILPIVASLGVTTIVLCQARKVGEDGRGVVATQLFKAPQILSSFCNGTMLKSVKNRHHICGL